MATVDDIIRVKIELDEEVKNLGKAKRKILGLKDLGRGVGAAMGGALATGFAMAAGATGLGILSAGIVGLHSQVQDAEIGMASLYSALSGTEIGRSLEISKSLIGDLREDAAKGAGELNDYTAGFQQIMGPAMAAGATLKEVRKLNREALAAGFAMRGQEGMKLIGFDIQQALSQGVGERTTPMVNMLLKAIGMTNKEFNKLTKSARLEKLSEAFGTMEDGAKLMGMTWGAQVATMKDGITELVLTLTEPVFDSWTKGLERANTWMEKNRDAMKEMAEVWAVRLRDVMAQIGSNAGTLGAAGVMAPLGVGAARGVGAMGGVGAIGSAAGGGAALGGGVLAGVLFLVGGAILMVKGALGEFPELLLGIADQGAHLASAFGNLLASFGSLTQEGSALNRFGAVIAGSFIVGVNAFAVGIDLVAAGIKFLGSGFLQMGLILDAVVARDFGRLKDLFSAGGELETIGKAGNEQLAKDVYDAFHRKPIRITSVRKDDADGPGGGLQGPGNKDKLEITIKTEVQDDPNRVAMSVTDVIAKLNEFRLQSASSPFAPKTV